MDKQPKKIKMVSFDEKTFKKRMAILLATLGIASTMGGAVIGYASADSINNFIDQCKIKSEISKLESKFDGIS